MRVRGGCAVREDDQAGRARQSDRPNAHAREDGMACAGVYSGAMESGWGQGRARIRARWCARGRAENTCACVHRESEL